MKLFMISFSICLNIAIIGVVAYLYLDQTSGTTLSLTEPTESHAQEPNADESALLVSKIPTKKLGEQTVKYEELTANLKDSYIVLSLSAVTDDKKSAEEAKQREFQMRNYLIKELSEVTSQQMSDSAFTNGLIKNLKSHMNQQMDEGIIYEIYITNKLVQ